jgi:hypothetical protein
MAGFVSVFVMVAATIFTKRNAPAASNALMDVRHFGRCHDSAPSAFEILTRLLPDAVSINHRPIPKDAAFVLARLPAQTACIPHAVPDIGRSFCHTNSLWRARLRPAWETT